MPLPTNSTTRLPSGVNTEATSSLFANFPLPRDSSLIEYFNDFFTYTTNRWVVTETQAGATQALTAGSGGWLLLTNSAADDDLVALQKTPAMLDLSATKQAWFSSRFKVSDATQSDVVIGMQVVDTTPLDVTDGIYFLKADGAATVNIVCRKDATTGSTSASAIATMVSDTFIQLDWYYDGAGYLFYAVNGTVGGSLSVASYFPDTTVTVSFGIQNGEAVAKTMTVDWVGVWQER
jgi:hypothetical protein